MSSKIKDYYYILGISRNASNDEVKKAYRKLSIKFHPDKNDGDKFFEERFKDINEAYETLIDDAKRKIYDALLDTEGASNAKQNYTPGPQSTTAKPSSPSTKRKRSTLFAILGGLIFLLPFLIKFAVTKINENEKSKKYSLLLKDTTKYKTDTATHYNNDSISLVKIYDDTTVSPPPLIDKEPLKPDPPGYSENEKLKDDDGQMATDAVNYFFNAFNNNDCHSAWNTTYNSYWISQGENWFCSSQAFGGVRKVSIKNIFTIAQEENTAEVYVDYYAEDIYNGNKCFKQTISLQKIMYTDNKQRWAITKMRNNEEPTVCNENQ